jgi:quercetin dioxygenase-like cupin family protein
MPDNVQVGRAHEVKPQLIDNEKVRKVQKRVLIGKAKGAKNFVMRLFTVEEGGYSPLHSHPWEHEVYIVSGNATVVTNNGEQPAQAGSYVFVPANALHQFKNTVKGNLEFICVIPNTAEEE